MKLPMRVLVWALKTKFNHNSFRGCVSQFYPYWKKKNHIGAKERRFILFNCSYLASF